jgi:hypothetical protein
MPTTPSRDASLRRRSAGTTSGTSSSPVSQDMSPEARMKRTRDIMSGAAFATTRSSPLSRVGNSRSREDDDSEPQTPTKYALRDRSSIKETHIFDPSHDDKTPTKRVQLPQTRDHTESSGLSTRMPVSASTEVSTKTAMDQAPKSDRRQSAVFGYPAGEPLRMGRTEILGDWTSRNSRERVQRYIAALQKCKDSQGWQDGEVIGQLHLPL